MLDRPSKRGRGGFLDLTGDEDSPQAQGNRAAHGLEGPLVAASSSLISDDEDAYLASHFAVSFLTGCHFSKDSCVLSTLLVHIHQWGI
jgi:hypothetical protein